MKKALTAVVATAVVGGIGISASPANAEETITIRPGDVNLSDTRSAGHNDFLRDGVRVHTDDSSSEAKAAGYFAVNKAFSDVTTATLDWHNEPGFTAIPGQQIVFDYDGIDGNGNDYNLLVGEPAYGENWWLTGGSSDDAKAADPSGAENGGNGSAWFGTLEEWSAAMPEARIYSGGWSLGSGVHGDGIIREMTYGDTTYTFTGDAEPVVERPTADASITVPKPRVAKVAMTAEQRPGTVPTAKGAYYKVLKVNPRSDRTTQVVAGRIFAGSTDRVRVTFPKAEKWMQVEVVSYGEVIAKHRVPVK